MSAAAGAAAGLAPLGQGPLGGEPEAPCILSGQAGDLLQVVMLEEQVEVEGQEAEWLQQEEQLFEEWSARRGGQPHEGRGLIERLQHIWRSKEVPLTYWNIYGTICGGNRGARGVRTTTRLEVRQPKIKKLGTERQKDRIKETRRRLCMSTELDTNWTTQVKQK